LAWLVSFAGFIAGLTSVTTFLIMIIIIIEDENFVGGKKGK